MLVSAIPGRDMYPAQTCSATTDGYIYFVHTAQTTCISAARLQLKNVCMLHKKGMPQNATPLTHIIKAENRNGAEFSKPSVLWSFV